MNEVVVEKKAKRINKAIAYASRLLGMREYSQKGLRQKIIIKGYEPQEAEQVIQYLLENNWLNEQRFCESFVRSKASRGQGLSRIRFALSDQDISGDTLEQVLEELAIDWQFICDDVTKRKVLSSSLQNNMKDRHKLQRFLRYRGFTGEQISLSTSKYLNIAGVNSGGHDE